MLTINLIEIITLLAIPSGISGLGFWYLKKHIDAKEAEHKAQMEARQQNEILLVESIRAAIDLGEATALALKNGKCNGETEAALEYAKEIKKSQEAFLHEQGIIHIYKED
ncbi:MAG: serine/threonine protein kinase [Ruminococcaceae bacterium]|nr:serine/threonine protein kinase [Oscillospiraceae bacterium]